MPHGASPPKQWRTPEELVTVGLQRSPVVMINEAHHGFLRSVRTRVVGRRILPTAHAMGARHLAMEALEPSFAAEANASRVVPELSGHGYLAQQEMRRLIADALDLGWTLIAYEPQRARNPRRDKMHDVDWEAVNERERAQAENLSASLPNAPLLVSCGWGHLYKSGNEQWSPMASVFSAISGLEPFCIDQTVSIAFGDKRPYANAWVTAYADELDSRGGAAGFLVAEAPSGWPNEQGVDAFLLALDNELV